MKVNKSFRIDEQHLSRLQHAALVRGITFSDILERAIVRYLATEAELTAVERYDMLKMVIETKLDGLLYAFGLTCLKGLSDKYNTALYMLSGISRHKNDESRKGLLELSIFEITNLIWELDTILFEQCNVEMGRYGRLRERYYRLYPEKRNTYKQENYSNDDTIIETIEEGVKGENEEEYIKSGKMRKHERNDKLF